MNNTKIIEMLKKASIAITFLAWEYDKTTFDTVLGDQESGINDALHHLVSNGHTEIGLINGETKYHVFKKRYDLFRLAMMNHNLSIHEEWIIEGPNSYFGGINSINQIRSRTENMPTAFFCTSDILAIGAMDAFKSAGGKIPQDISFIGYDNISESQKTNPPLTTIDTNMQMTIMVLVNKIMLCINNPDKRLGTIVVPTRLIERGSVADRKPGSSS